MSSSSRSGSSWRYPSLRYQDDDDDDDDEVSRIRRRKAEKSAYGIVSSDYEEENVWSLSYTFFYNYYLFELNFFPR